MDTHLRVLSESYPMNTNMIGFGWFLKIFASLCFWAKVASACSGQKSANYFGELFVTRPYLKKYSKKKF